MNTTAGAAATLAAAGALLVAATGAVESRLADSTSVRASETAPQLSVSAADRMPLAEFKRLFDAGQVVVLDVRGTASWRDGRVPGAVAVPLDTVGRRAAEWKGETRPVVTYCS
jgi:hypothetical protein